MKNKNSENYLDYIPICAPDHEFTVRKDGIVVIHQEHKGFYNKIAQKIYKRPKVSNIDLDEFGSFVWKQMDGKRTIYEISLLVKEQFGEEAEPLIPRLTEFFRILFKNQFIGYVKEKK